MNTVLFLLGSLYARIKRFTVPILFFLASLFLALLWMGIWPSAVGIFAGLVIWTLVRKNRDANVREFFGGLALSGFVLPALALLAFAIVAVSVA